MRVVSRSGWWVVVMALAAGTGMGACRNVSGGCSAAGDRPGAGTVILFVAFALVGLLRARRSE